MSFVLKDQSPRKQARADIWLRASKYAETSLVLRALAPRSQCSRHYHCFSSAKRIKHE
ncbi:hypothetical protein EXN66_Car010209 [Channa argus]|uniref:Uncharacterized protein n=1 Tax=Channa argus TaxID=215402 RepID=A0A6G1PWH6_CHAAH|nr:hypothetical protein EXN66_Car010209 [Channa argus]